MARHGMDLKKKRQPTRAKARRQSRLTRSNSPFPLEGGLLYVGDGYHLLSRPDPHDGAVVALPGIHPPQAGERPPRKSPLQPEGETNECVGHGGVSSHFLFSSPVERVFRLDVAFSPIPTGKKRRRSKKQSCHPSLSTPPDAWEEAESEPRPRR